jgi:DNA-binding transcriptional regulator YhcF (GntR family)
MKIFFFRHKDGFATVKASRLVAKAYLGLKENQFVTHKDGNCANAKASNLLVLNKKELGELVGRKLKEGLRNYWKGVYSGEIQRKPRKHCKLTVRKVQTIRSLAGIQTWSSLAKKYKVNISTISKVMAGKSWKHVK